MPFKKWRDSESVSTKITRAKINLALIKTKHGIKCVVHKINSCTFSSASGLMKRMDQEDHLFCAQIYHIGLISHVMKTMTFLMKKVLPNIWKQDDAVITKITFSLFIANIPVHMIGHIIGKNKNVFLRVGI